MVGRRHRYGRSALGGVAVIGAAVGALHVLQTGSGPTASLSPASGREPDCTVAATLTTCSEANVARPAAARQPRFRNGSYTVQGRYLTPGGAEAIGVGLTVSGDRIVRSSVRVEATSPTARQFQRQFSTRFAPAVMSRDLGSVAVSRVAGASLTSLGFDSALAQIRTQARVQG